MGRIRSIKPEFPQSETLGRVSRDARLLFINLFTLVDDAGRTRAAPRALANLLYPYDDDAQGLIDRWLHELDHVGAIQRYTVEGCAYLAIPNWLKHQRINRPSPPKFPPPPERSMSQQEDSLNAHGGLTEGSLRDRMGSDGIGRDQDGPTAPLFDQGEEQPDENYDLEFLFRSFLPICGEKNRARLAKLIKGTRYGEEMVATMAREVLEQREKMAQRGEEMRDPFSYLASRCQVHSKARAVV